MKIGFILSSSIAAPLASTRIAVLNIMPSLARAGFEPHVICESLVATEYPTLDLDADRIADEGLKSSASRRLRGLPSSS